MTGTEYFDSLKEITGYTELSNSYFLRLLNLSMEAYFIYTNKNEGYGKKWEKYIEVDGHDEDYGYYILNTEFIIKNIFEIESERIYFNDKHYIDNNYIEVINDVKYTKCMMNYTRISDLANTIDIVNKDLFIYVLLEQFFRLKGDLDQANLYEINWKRSI